MSMNAIQFQPGLSLAFALSPPHSATPGSMVSCWCSVLASMKRPKRPCLNAGVVVLCATGSPLQKYGSTQISRSNRIGNSGSKRLEKSDNYLDKHRFRQAQDRLVEGLRQAQSERGLRTKSCRINRCPGLDNARALLTPCVPQACPRIGQPLAFPIQAPVTLGGAFFRWAALVLHLDGAFLFGGCGGGCLGGVLPGRGLRASGEGHQAQCHAGAQDGGGALTLTLTLTLTLCARAVQDFLAMGYVHECSMAGRVGWQADWQVGRVVCGGIPYDAALPLSTPIPPCAKPC